MRPSTKIIATGALALFLMPALRIYAAAPVSSDTAKGDKAADSSSSSLPEAAASLPSAPMPSAYMHANSYYSAQTNGGMPRFELFVGYSYIRAVPSLAAGNRMVWLSGGSTSLAVNLTRHFGMVADFGAFRDSQLRLGGINPAIIADSKGKAFTYLFGPRITLGNRERVAPFVQALFGGIHASAVTVAAGCSGPGCTPLPSETKFAMALGGGLDVRLRRHLAIRVIQAEYLMTKFSDLDSGANGTQNDVRLSTGLVFRFGYPRDTVAAVPMPVPSLSYSCSVSPATVYPGESITVSGVASNLNPSLPVTYSWNAAGGTVAGTSNMAKIDTSGTAPGTYTLKGHVSEGGGAEQNSDCSASYEVRAYDPPTVSCSANPSLISPGESSTITASGASPQNRPLTYSYTSMSGTVSGTGTTATLSSTGVGPGVITVNCSVTDDLGRTASSSAAVTVHSAVAAEKPAVSQLCSIIFDRDARRPARVNNEAKACLDEIALNLQRNSDATLAIVGNSAHGERNGKVLASQRGTNTKAYLVSDKGIDPSRIVVYAGKQDGKMVSATLIPSGATFDSDGDTPVGSAASGGHK